MPYGALLMTAKIWTQGNRKWEINPSPTYPVETLLTALSTSTEKATVKSLWFWLLADRGSTDSFYTGNAYFAFAITITGRRITFFLSLVATIGSTGSTYSKIEDTYLLPHHTIAILQLQHKLWSSTSKPTKILIQWKSPAHSCCYATRAKRLKTLEILSITAARHQQQQQPHTPVTESTHPTSGTDQGSVSL